MLKAARGAGAANVCNNTEAPAVWLTCMPVTAEQSAVAAVANHNMLELFKYYRRPESLHVAQLSSTSAAAAGSATAAAGSAAAAHPLKLVVVH
jgi:hypothetical protein